MTDTYKVSIKKSAEKELRSIPSKDLARIAEKMKQLSQEPRPHGCEKMEGEERYRIRQGDWRIICSIDDKDRTVMIFKIGHRKEIYR